MIDGQVETMQPTCTNLDGFGEGEILYLRFMGLLAHMCPGISTDSGLLVLESLFPVVKLLPGLTRETNSGYVSYLSSVCILSNQTQYYYAHGKIGPSELESLYNEAGRIGELTLGGEPDSESRLLHVLARIAQLQDPNKQLFSHLRRLRIIKGSLSLNFLHLFLSSALTTVELTAIPVDDPCYSSVLSFLECATYQAPNLSTLILGPGLIPGQLVDISLRYKNLRCLKLLDVGISITDQLLQGIGSLQHLEHFYFQESGASTYKRSIIPAAAEHARVPEQVPEDPTPILPEDIAEEGMTYARSPSPSEWSQCSTPEPTTSPKNERTEAIIVESLPIPDAATQTIDSPLFPVLQSLVIFCDLSLIEDLVAKISSSDLRMLVINFTKLIQASEENLRKATKGPKMKMKGLVKPVSSSLQLQQQVLPQISTAEITTLMRSSVTKWVNTLEVVTFSNAHIPTTFSLPSDVFQDLLLRPDMKHIEITGMGIDSIDGTLNRLKEVSDPKLKDLHLPIHSTAPTISPARLRSIAEAYPRLKSFRCRFKHLSNIPVSPQPMSHPLEVLSVTNEQAHPEQQRSFDIARYLDSMFPNLKSILTHDGDGNNPEQWGFIFDLVKLCQTARMNDEDRRALEFTQ